MELKDTKIKCNKIFKNAGVMDYINNTNILCSFVLCVKKSDLVLIKEITEKNHTKILKLAKKRASGIPLQHITKIVDFYGTKIYVNSNVLIPRNETEQLCDIVKSSVTDGFTILDLCSGSGCIGISLKNANKSLDVTLTDISKKANYVERKNAKLNNVKVKVLNSDLFNNIKLKYNVIVSNPPYIKTSDLEKLSAEVKHDPVLALDGKADGLWFYKEIINHAVNHLEKSGEIFFECGYNQAQSIAKYLEKNFESIKIIKDYYGANRFVSAKLKD